MDDSFEVDNETNLWDGYLNVPLLNGDLFDGFTDPEEVPTQRVTSTSPVPLNTYPIADVPVTFPGEPYHSQKRIMESIIESLKREENSLIESPTGSGKTLAILCAVLGWKEHEYLRDPESDNNKKKIFYCTKTHAQVSTVIKELKKTEYASPDALPRLKVTILGSRSQMCVNEAINGEGGTEKNIDDACSVLVRNSKRNRNERNPPPQPLPDCKYFKEKSYDYFSMNEQGYSEIRDIEDLRNTAKQQGCCAFFGSRHQLSFADLIICPYNYIISSFIRKSLRIDLTNSIVIFDEGHNLEKALCTEGSMSLKDKMFAEIRLKCHKLKLEQDVSLPVKLACENLFTKFQGFHNWIKSFSNERSSALPFGRQVTSALKNHGLGKDDLESLKSYLKDARDDAQYGPILDNTTSQRIQKVITVLDYLYNSGTSNSEEYMESEDFNENNYFLKLENIYHRGVVVETKLNIICVNPAIVFQEIAEQTSTIAITSGTLTPLDSFGAGLGVNFDEPLSLEQAIPRDRYWAAKLAVGPKGPLEELTFRKRNDELVQLAVGDIILKICETVPHGVLVFCPSKDFISKMIERWELTLSQSGSVMDSIRNSKHVVNECDMKDPENTRRLLKEYREKSREGKGALPFGVHRGKMSEGVDFKDEEARAVINLGIPYAKYNSPEVSAMRHFDNDRSFDRWYKTDAFRAVNQGLGRTVRHRDDWGAIIMVDPRFIGEEESRLISPWIQNASKVYSDPLNGEFERMIEDLRRFVRSML